MAEASPSPRTPGAVEGATRHAPMCTASTIVQNGCTAEPWALVGVADGLDGFLGPGIFSEV